MAISHPKENSLFLRLTFPLVAKFRCQDLFVSLTFENKSDSESREVAFRLLRNNMYKKINSTISAPPMYINIGCIY